MSMVFLVPHSTSTSLQVLLLYSSFSDTYHILPHIILCPLLLLATNNSSSPTLLSSTFLYVLLLVHHGVARLSPLLMFHPLAHTLFPPSTPTSLLSATPFLSIPLLLLSSSPLLLQLLLCSYFQLFLFFQYIYFRSFYYYF